MKKNNLLMKGFAMLVIILFLGASIVTGIGGNNGNNNSQASLSSDMIKTSIPETNFDNLNNPLSNADDDWDYQTNAPHMFSNVTGNVGIGTEFPSTKLHVNGSLKVDDATGASVLYVNSTSGYIGVGTESPTYKFDIRGSESLPILNVYQNGSSRGVRVYTENACALWVENAGNHGLRVSHADGDGIHVQEADGWAGYFNGKGYFGENVGIDVSNPLEMLEVNGVIYSRDGGFRFPDGTVQTTAATGGGIGNTLDQAYDQGGPGVGRIIFADSGPVRIAGTDGLIVDGNVGINTTEPDHELEVDGYVKADGYYTDDIIFQKGGIKLWRMYVDDNGVYLENMLSGQIFRLVILKDSISYASNEELEQKIIDLQEENDALNERITALESALAQI